MVIDRMFSLLAIPIVNEVTSAASRGTPFFDRSIDAILFDILVLFGWIPIAVTLGWGFVKMWLNYRQGIYSSKLKHIVLAIDVPIATEQSPKALENLFSALYGTKSTLTWKEKWIDGRFHPVFSFEIVSTEGYIQFLVRTQTKFRDVIEAGIYANYPDAEIVEVEDYASKFPNEFPNDEYEMWGAEMTLDKKSMYPIRTYVDFEDRMTQEIKDPLAVTLEQIGKMRAGEHFWIQFLVQPSTNEWMEEGIKYVQKIYGKEEKPKKNILLSSLESTAAWPTGILKEATGIDITGILGGEGTAAEEDPWKVFKISLPEKEEAEAIFRKASKVGHGVKVRILYVARKNAYVKLERTGIVKGILNQYSHLNFNRFALYIPQIPKDDYFWMRWVYTKKQHRLMVAYQWRSWGIGATPVWLNAEELASLWHFPTIAIKAPLVKKAEFRRAEPPVGLPITAEEELSVIAPPPEVAIPPMVPPLPISDEPLPDTLPHPSAPTLAEEGARQSTEEFVPPNLPI